MHLPRVTLPATLPPPVRAALALARHARDPGFVRRLADAGLAEDRRVPLTLPAIHLWDAFPEVRGLAVDMPGTAWSVTNVDPLERFTLLALVALRRPRRIVEIGTYDGTTTLALARAAPEAEVLTLDLPPDGAAASTEEATRAHAAAGGVGSAFAGLPEARRITQLYGDSTTFDWTPWHGTADLVLVDAGHEYAFARADSLSALALAAPGAVIAYDDYMGCWPGVVAAVHDLPADVLARTFRVAGTDLAVTDLARPPLAG